jgi:phage/plasmid-like protein (TIGR03299 family)
MAHEIETMAYVSNEQNGRFVPWHGLGVPVSHTMTSKEAMEIAGLDWTVDSRPIFTDSGIQIPGYVANTRSSDNSVLGVVTEKYKIVQNADAFAFTDNLIGEDCRYETAGSLRNGKKIWLLANLPRTKILDDDVDQYLCFTNNHDGTGAVKVAITPVRVVCNNTLNLALSNATRSWSCKHMGKMEDKLAEATHTLKLANRYMEELKVKADEYAHTKFDMDKVKQVVAELFPIKDDDSDRHKANMTKARNDFMVCYFMPDIRKFNGTQWGLINAAADYADHTQPQRMTATYAENNFERVVVGHPILDYVVNRLSANV